MRPLDRQDDIAKKGPVQNEAFFKIKTKAETISYYFF